jgi:hypothetical protein
MDVKISLIVAYGALYSTIVVGVWLVFLPEAEMSREGGSLRHRSAR